MNYDFFLPTSAQIFFEQSLKAKYLRLILNIRKNPTFFSYMLQVSVFTCIYSYEKIKHSLLISSVWVLVVILYLIKIWRAMIQNGN